MRVQPECYDCILRLLLDTLQAATDHPDLQARAEEVARALLEQGFGTDVVPAVLASRIQRKIRAVCSCPDPMRAQKAREMELAGRIAATQPRPAGLAECLQFAARGNAIDFFRPLEEVVEELSAPVAFTRDHSQPFFSHLGHSGAKLLYLADNAGEILFDEPLVRHLRQELNLKVAYVVKGSPVQNDATRQDFAQSGVDFGDVAVITTGSDVVGVDLGQATFMQTLASADLVVAKGMGNYETLSELEDLQRFLFLLQAKCLPVARSLGVTKGAYVAVWLRDTRHPGRGT